MVEVSSDSVLELSLGEAATEALSKIRETFSRLHYAPSRKTILRAILDALPKWCMEGLPELNGIKNHRIIKHRSRFPISRRESRMLTGDLFTTSLADVDISIAVDFVLTARLFENQYDLRGAILKYLSSKQYLKGKNLLMFRLPPRLQHQILPEAPVGDSSSVDTWKTRCLDLSGELQKILQKKLETLFHEATTVRKHWPPMLEDRRKHQIEARDLIRKSQDADVVSVLLSEGLLFKIRRMSEDNFETAAITTLLWCEECEVIQNMGTI